LLEKVGYRFHGGVGVFSAGFSAAGVPFSVAFGA
jgi:hypothetical protein